MSHDYYLFSLLEEWSMKYNCIIQQTETKVASNQSGFIEAEHLFLHQDWVWRQGMTLNFNITLLDIITRIGFIDAVHQW